MDIQQNVQEQLNQFQQVQQQAQSIAMQKQTVSLQINEAKKALDELSKNQWGPRSLQNSWTITH